MNPARGQLALKLTFLHHHPKLPRSVTAGRGRYSPPVTLCERVLETDFSDGSLQEISNDIARFLGVLNSVRVTVGVETSDNMLGVRGDVTRADAVGFYRVSAAFGREVELTKKSRFSVDHVLAILAHETMHNYLDYWGIREEDKIQNEILTDVAAVYVGLGDLLLKGYKPLSWISESTLTERTVRTIRIGYVDHAGICYAIRKATQLRKLRELAGALPLSYRLLV